MGENGRFPLKNNTLLKSVLKLASFTMIYDGGEALMSSNRVVNKLNLIISIGAVFILTLPCTGWLFVGIYGQAIQIPRERAEFEKQEAAILAALDTFQEERGAFPERLSNLAPDYLSSSTFKGNDWSFRYHVEDDGYFLTSHLPSRWFGWSIEKVCYADSVGDVSCSHHYICRVSKSGYDTEPVPTEDLQQKAFWVKRENPCVGVD